MEHRQLGRTGLRVSRVGLGCGGFGGIGSAPELFGKGESEAEAFRLMDRAFDVGIDLFDTADAYGGGASETFIGKWLKSKGPRARDRVIVCTKVFNPVGDGPNDRGLSRRHVKRQVDASLARLGLDRIDLYMIHASDSTTPLEETLGAMDDLVRAGKIHYIGASNVEAWRLARALWISDKHGLSRFDCVQNAYSLLDRTPEAEMFPLCEDQEVGFTPFSPLAGGWLTGKYRAGESYPAGSRMSLRPESSERLANEKTFRGLDALARVAREREVDVPTLALAWVLSHPRVTAAIVGPRRPEQLEPALHAVDLALDAAERAAIAKLFE